MMGIRKVNMNNTQETYLVAVHYDHSKKEFSTAKRKESSLASTGKIITHPSGMESLSWSYLNRPDVNRQDLDMWDIPYRGITDFEADRRIANIRHDYEADGYTKVKVYGFPESHP